MYILYRVVRQTARTFAHVLTDIFFPTSFVLRDLNNDDSEYDIIITISAVIAGRLIAHVDHLLLCTAAAGVEYRKLGDILYIIRL